MTGLILTAIISDTSTYKIKNAVIIIFITAGLASNLASAGIAGLLGSVSATILPIAVLFALFALKMLGAGDIKLFSAIGAITGLRFVLYCMSYSFISGGVIAILIMLFNKNFRERASYLITYLKACFLSRSLQPYSDFTRHDGSTFRFSYAIACGVIITVIEQGILL